MVLLDLGHGSAELAETSCYSS